MTRAVYHLRIFIAVIPAVFLLYVLLADINISGSKKIVYDLVHDQPMISRLFPATRLSGATANGQRMLFEPVYFWLRYSQKYSLAEVSLTYSNPSKTPIQLGLEQDIDGVWVYQYQPLADDKQVTKHFDLSLARIRDGNIRFGISAPKMDQEIDEIVIKQIEVILSKQPITSWKEILPALGKTLGQIYGA